MWWGRKVVVSKGRASASTLEGVESNTVTKFGDTNDRRVILLDEFPETYKRLVKVSRYQLWDCQFDIVSNT